LTLKNIDNNAVFTIRNNQTYDKDTELIEVTTEGRFYFRNGSYFLLYTEYTDLGEISVLIRAAKDTVSIRRSGACSTRMEYKSGTHQEVLYHLPFGDMVIDLDTQKVENFLTESGGNIKLKYSLTVNHEKYYNDMEIKCVL
jgi:uncharacterized beta-barrel protein YwiB (DUF1934 family)